MKPIYKWPIWLGCASLVISMVFNVFLVRRNFEHELNMRIVLSLGIMSYRTAIQDLKNGKVQKSMLDEGQGHARLNTASNNLLKQHDNIVKLNSILQNSIYEQANKKYSSKRIAQDNQVFNVVFKTFQPLISHPNTVNNKDLNKDFQKVFNSMTPQQKQTMGG